MRLLRPCSLIAILLISCKHAPEPSSPAPPGDSPRQDAFWPMHQRAPARTGSAPAPPMHDTPPAILWHARVGAQTRHHSPVISADTVFIGSAGAHAGAPDPGDGVQALDLHTGATRWFSRSPHDVHGTSWFDGLIITTHEHGLIRALDAATGDTVWEHAARNGARITASPLVLNEHSVVVVGTHAGEVLLLNAATGEPLVSLSLGGEIHAGASSDGERIFIATTTGEVAALSVSGEVLWRKVQSYGVAQESPDMVQAEPARFTTSPVVVEELLVLAYARSSSSREPPWMALDRATGELAWEPEWYAMYPEQLELEASPAYAQDMLIFPAARARHTLGYLVGERRAEFISRVPACMRSHSSSPVRATDTLYMGRMDGMLYATTTVLGGVEWRLYLGMFGESEYPAQNKTAPGECHKTAPAGHGIASALGIAPDGSILVSTTQGILYKLGRLNASGPAAPE